MSAHVNVNVRPDLAQEVTFERNSGEGISPCCRILHRMAAELGGKMNEQIDILGTDDAVRISVPPGTHLVDDGAGGYTLESLPQ